MSKQTNLVKGMLFALLTATISGVSIFYSKISVAKIDPLVLTASRNVIVGLLFLVLIVATRRYRDITKLTGKDVIMLFFVGIIGGGIPFYLFFSGLKLIGAQQGNMLHKTLFIWVALAAFVFLKEKINTKMLLGGLFVFVGTYFFTPIRLIMGQGALFILAADLLWTVETVVAKKVLDRVSPDLVGLSRMLIGGGLLVALTFATGKGGAIFALGMPQLTMIAVGAALLFFYVYSWYRALSKAPASVVALVLTWSLVVGNLLGGAFANTRLSAADWYSMTALSGGVILGMISVNFIGKNTLTNDNQTVHE